MSQLYNFPGMQPVVRVIDKPGEVVSLIDGMTNKSRFVRTRETNRADGRQALELSDFGAFLRIRTVLLANQTPADLWPDVKARFFFDASTHTWRTCFFVPPSVKVNRQEQRRSQRDHDAAGPNIATGIGEIDGRRAVDKLARVVTSNAKEPTGHAWDGNDSVVTTDKPRRRVDVAASAPRAVIGINGRLRLESAAAPTFARAHCPRGSRASTPTFGERSVHAAK
jgi:hypothetical protein